MHLGGNLGFRNLAQKKFYRIDPTIECFFTSKKQENYLQTCELVFGASFLGFQHFFGTINGRPTTTTDSFIDGMTETETELNRKIVNPPPYFFPKPPVIIFSENCSRKYFSSFFPFDSLGWAERKPEWDIFKKEVLVVQGYKWISCTPTLLVVQVMGDVAGDLFNCYGKL